MFDLVKRRGGDYSLHRYCLDFVYTLTLRSRYAAIRNTHDIERAQLTQLPSQMPPNVK